MSTHLSVRCGGAVLAAVLLAATASCSDGARGPVAGPGGGAATPTAEAAAPDTRTELATAAFPTGWEGIEATVTVHELRRRGELVNLVFSVSHDGAERINLYTLHNDWAVTLVDPVNSRRHTVVADGNQEPLQPDTVSTYIAPGTPTPLSYGFTAPPPDVTAMDVYIAAFPPFRDVPVSP
ncbi:hypothetical protein [Allonocardiopsis opalescens]|uniref:Secreted protein n=1 Tax=Allonocardiopsis opalescens TaxID=1144618 RepID=A0A2T0Q4F3_9ACTN|nr:hypothetical protein [Allonocardiopsis opalescens]PRX98695.1 hypothetical protein CLV72_104274 [Allonocardiopsis opalescens]